MLTLVASACSASHAAAPVVPAPTSIAPSTTTTTIDPIIARIRQPDRHGDLHVAIVMLEASDETGPPVWTASGARDVLANGPKSVDAAIFDMSYGRVHLVGLHGREPEAFGWYRTPIGLHAKDVCDESKWRDAALARAPQLAAYDDIVILVPNLNCDWGGLGQPGTVWINVDPQQIAYSVRTMLHEFGHALGLNHMGRETCIAGGKRVQMSSTCTLGAYDPYDFMGDGTNRRSTALHRFLAGMLPLANARVVTTGSVELDDADRLGAATTNLVLVPFDGGRRFYALEVHAAGVFVRATEDPDHNNDGVDTLLFDATPGSVHDDTSDQPSLPDFRDAALTAGHAFVDPVNHLRFTVTQAGGGRATLRIGSQTVR
jgi:hypothetical protein